MKLLGKQVRVNRDKCLSWMVEQAPCRSACPLGLDIEGYIGSIAKGDFEGAINIILEKCAMPAVMGRVCHHPCETACKKLKKGEEPVAIRSLKRLAGDYWLVNGANKSVKNKITEKKKVAIIGSGPAGLSAAYHLVRQGYPVTIFEASSVAGGMLSTAIPDFVLPSKVVEAEVNYIKTLGVEIKTKTPITGNLNDLKKEGYKAILIATGAQQEAKLNVPGKDLQGIFYGLTFLRNLKLQLRSELQGKVCIIGGGNVGVDVARAAIRLGAKEVHLACLESKIEMPAFPWEIEKAVEEGVMLHPRLAPQQFYTKDGKHVNSVQFKRIESLEIDKEGRLSWTVRAGTANDYTMDVDAVIIAIGQTVNVSLGDTRDLISEKGTLIADPNMFCTKIPGLFAAGDVVSGAKTIVDAMAAGSAAAGSIERYLSGRDLQVGPSRITPITGENNLPERMRPRDRQVIPKLPLLRRITSFEEVDLGYEKKYGIQEAGRCLTCENCNRCIEDYACVAMKWQTNDKLPKYSPEIDLNMCIGCQVCPQICQYKAIEFLEVSK